MRLTGRIIQHMRLWRTRSISQVTAALGKYISASQAMRAREHLTRAQGTKKLILNPLQRGRRDIIANAMTRLAKQGILLRIAKGVYKSKL